MKVVLKENVDSLGRRGTIADVTDGYARNYLIPQGFAVAATKENIRSVELERRAYLAREAKRIEDAQDIAAAIAKLTFTVTMKANDDGHLFGSVSDRVVADALQVEKITIEPKMVRMDTPIRELGVYDIRIHLHPEVDASAKLWVVKEKNEEAAPAPAAAEGTAPAKPTRASKFRGV
jgi:large subunit ribosomal protein L9